MNASLRQPAAAEVSLLGGLAVSWAGARVLLPPSAQRVLAFVALHGRPVQRAYVAGTLWLDSNEQRAQANLRSALWRLSRPGLQLVAGQGALLALAPSVVLDVAAADRLARDVLLGAADDAAAARSPSLLLDVLPDWYDDWVVLERERFRQLRLRALDALSERLTAAGRTDEALQAAHAALAADPLRESTHRALVRVHLTEGNVGEAVRQYELYRRLLHEQLGLEPSPLMQELVVALSARG